MRISFRQGVVSHQPGGFLQVSGVVVNILAGTRPTTVSLANRDSNYTHSEDNTVTGAWVGPFPEINHWLFWDFNTLDFTRSFGQTTIEPIFQPTEPVVGPLDSFGVPLIIEGRHWFDTTNNIHFLRSAGVWVPVLRVFAARLINGVTLSSLSDGSLLGIFTGTQIGNNTSVFSGRVLFGETDQTIIRDDGSFFTTEDQFFTNQSRVDAIRLEANVIRALNTAPALSAFSVVSWIADGQVGAAQYDDIGNTVIGIVLEDVVNLEIAAVLVQGVVTNPIWDWITGITPVPVGSPLWVVNGELVTVDPFISDPILNPVQAVPIARVLSTDTVVFEQGLGGVGPAGPPGSITGFPPADTSVLGGVTLVSPSSDPLRAFVISDLDPRLSNARTPLAHLHQAVDIAFTPGGGIISNNVQNAILEVNANSSNTNWLGLTDTPPAFGAAGQVVTVNGATNGLEFTTPSPLGRLWP